MQDTASLLYASNFYDVTITTEDIKIIYPALMDLLKDLQLMGESSALIQR